MIPKAQGAWLRLGAISFISRGRFNTYGFMRIFDLPLILAHAFQKKTQKTPKRAIKIVEEREKDYFRRKKK
jgi:phage-related protein